MSYPSVYYIEWMNKWQPKWNEVKFCCHILLKKLWEKKVCWFGWFENDWWSCFSYIYKLPYEMRKFERKKNLFMYEKEF